MTKKVELEVLEDIGVLTNTITTDDSPLSQVLDELGLAIDAISLTDLTLGTLTSTTFDIDCSTGTGVTIPVATVSVAGAMPAAAIVNIAANLANIAVLQAADTALNTEIANLQLSTGIGSGGVDMGEYASDIPGTWDDKSQIALNQLLITALEDVDGVTNLGVGSITTTTLDVTSDTGADVTVPAATGATAGLVSASDKTKLDYLSVTGAFDADLALTAASLLEDLGDVSSISPSNGYVLTWNTSLDKWKPDLIPVQNANLTETRDTISVTVESSSGTDATIGVATTSLAGVMSAADKTDLDDLLAMRDNGRFMARKSTTQATTTSWTDLATWLASDTEGSDFTWTASTGILEINTDGDYEIGWGVSGEGTAAGRSGVEARMQLDTGAGYGTLAQTHKGAYARFSSVQQYADATLSVYERAFNDGDKLKLQIQHTTNSLDCEAHLRVRRVG